MKVQTLILFCIILLFAPKNSSAQTSKTDSTKIPHAYWVSLGLGGSSFGLDAMGTFNAEIGNQLIITAEAQGESGIINSVNSASTIDLLIGKAYKNGSTLLLLSAGVGQSSINSQNTFNVPVMVQYHIVAGQFIGIGLAAYGNINSQPTVGLNLSFVLGRVATHK